MTRWLHLRISYRALAGGGRSVGRQAGSWSNIHGLTLNLWNAGATDDGRCMAYSVFDACCTRCMPHSVECCTRCKLMIITWRDREGWKNFEFCDDDRVVDEKERNGRCRWEWYGRYERISEIGVTTYLIGFRRLCFSVNTCRMGTHTCAIGDSNLNCTRNSLVFQFRTLIFPSALNFTLT